ncbi:MAG: hydroxyacylglutathione hydrolase [Candidatus Pelagibacter sp.]|nr:hydroxyacylglutathione hydrolase [Candidatus Pelagibacter sp.]OUV86682.1 MAG: hydroxyacylglutathione hydrolase [Pelagibacteraceae bacterium TMED136]|tara:strand:- start:9489 stop:10259 length:771 start_codon:yes stop_codon:yes gene_type:complete
MSHLIVKIVKCLSNNYSYIIFNPNSKKAIVIDPAEATPVMNEINKLSLELNYILITHHHEDHVGGNIELKNKLNCKIVGFSKDAVRIPGIDIKINNNEIFNFENEEIQLNFSPGHTNGHIFYYFKKNKLAFVGDVVFSLGCGRIFEGNTDEMYNSVMKIRSLPDETKIYCGHEYTESNLKFCLKYDENNYDLKKRANEVQKLRGNNLPTIPTTILDEKKSNIFFRCNNESIARKLELEGQPPIKVFKKLRELKDNF